MGWYALIFLGMVGAAGLLAQSWREEHSEKPKVQVQCAESDSDKEAAQFIRAWIDSRGEHDTSVLHALDKIDDHLGAMDLTLTALSHQRQHKMPEKVTVEIVSPVTLKTDKPLKAIVAPGKLKSSKPPTPEQWNKLKKQTEALTK